MRVLTDSVLTALRASTIPVGDAEAPAGAAPYAVLYPLSEGDRDGDLSTIDVTGWWEYQITSVGVTRVQAQGVADDMRSRLLASEPTVSGYKTGPWRKGVSGIVDRDDDVQPPVFYCIDTAEVFVSPA